MNRTGCKSMELFYQNVRGLRTKTSKFRSFLESSSIDFYAVTETGCNDSIHDAELIPSSFKLMLCDRTDGRKQGGVLFVAAPRYELREVNNIVNLNDYKFEMVCVTVHLQYNFLFACCVVYIPPQTYENEYFVMFDLIERMCLKYKGNIIVIGDFNLCSANSNVLTYYDFFVAYCEFAQSNQIPNCNNRQLDLVIVGAAVRGGVGVRAADDDDGLRPADAYHPPLVVDVGAPPAPPAPSAPHAPPHHTESTCPDFHCKQWNFYRANFDRLYNSLASLDWSGLYYVFL